MRFQEKQDELHRFVCFEAFKDLPPEPYRVSSTISYAQRRWLEKEIDEATGAKVHPMIRQFDEYFMRGNR